MKKFFSHKAAKVGLAILALWLAAVAVCNAVFAFVALKEQKGTAVCDAWSENDLFDVEEIQALEMGNRTFKVLCLTDIHIRNFATFGASWLGTNFVLDGISRIRIGQMIREQKPDLIIVGGDTVLTQWNDICTRQFAEFMDTFEIPWAPVFGNHDGEGRADKAKLAEIYESAEYCLFRCGPAGMDGMGNYVVNLTRNGEIAYTLFLFDDGQYRITDGEISDGGINDNQIAWFRWTADGIAEAAGRPVPCMAFMHVPVPEYANQRDAFSAGQRAEESCTAKINDGFFSAFQGAGGTHLFAGHDHNNNFLSEYEGTQLNYMTKSSYNCYFTSAALGGTVICFDENNRTTVEIVRF